MPGMMASPPGLRGPADAVDRRKEVALHVDNEESVGGAEIHKSSLVLQPCLMPWMAPWRKNSMGPVW